MRPVFTAGMNGFDFSSLFGRHRSSRRARALQHSEGSQEAAPTAQSLHHRLSSTVLTAQALDHASVAVPLRSAADAPQAEDHTQQHALEGRRVLQGGVLPPPLATPRQRHGHGRHSSSVTGSAALHTLREPVEQLLPDSGRSQPRRQALQSGTASPLPAFTVELLLGAAAAALSASNGLLLPKLRRVVDVIAVGDIAGTEINTRDYLLQAAKAGADMPLQPMGRPGWCT